MSTPGRGGGSSGQIKEVGSLGVVEVKHFGHRAEDGVGHSGEVAAFQSGVVVDADSGQQRHFLTTQAGDAAFGPVGGNACLLGCDTRPTRRQEIADLSALVHTLDSKPRCRRGKGVCWYLGMAGTGGHRR
jgi:hypothetical protein